MATKRTKTGIVAVDKALDEIRDELAKATSRQRLLVWASNDLQTVVADRFLVPGWTGTTNNERGLVPMPRDGRLSGLTIYQDNEGTGAADLTFVVRVNKKDTPLTVTIPNVSSGVFRSRADLSVPVKAGDIVGICVRKSAVLGASTSALVAVLEFTP